MFHQIYSINKYTDINISYVNKQKMRLGNSLSCFMAYLNIKPCKIIVIETGASQQSLGSK